jgi:predicted enzyme related to lactoylglutathione lyase
MMQMAAEFGDAPSHWMSYVAVTDVDATAQRVEELGGKICVPPTDIPKVGRFCVITDPTGATISLITLQSH